MTTIKQTLKIVLLSLFVIAFMKCDSITMRTLGLILILVLFHKLMFLMQKLSTYYIQIKFFNIKK